ncbi:hypothetical protein SAMN04488544_1002 [Microlunatus sagamiharensis]|uniref:Uncharacterized protein n=1 Tax=Microlunatus sagamiharensis TaxID=546874 RepID=A0A1H2LWZ7_9ACTN|nr:hypothetical protein SAMN04488544_1002 [Microlunatus sagamiharensis]
MSARGARDGENGRVWWVLLFVAIALGGAVVLVLVGLRVWRSARGLLHEVDVLAVRATELADLVAQVEVALPARRASLDGHGSEPLLDSGWPGTVEPYDDRGATAPGKKEL